VAVTTHTTALHDGWTLDVVKAGEDADPRVLEALPIPSPQDGV
jgi:hypothetical protein